MYSFCNFSNAAWSSLARMIQISWPPRVASTFNHSKQTIWPKKPLAPVNNTRCGMLGAAGSLVALDRTSAGRKWANCISSAVTVLAPLPCILLKLGRLSSSLLCASCMSWAQLDKFADGAKMASAGIDTSKTSSIDRENNDAPKESPPSCVKVLGS